VLIKDIQGCDYIMLDDMNKDIVVSHVGVIGFHMVSVFFGQPVISFDAGAELFLTVHRALTQALLVLVDDSHF